MLTALLFLAGLQLPSFNRPSQIHVDRHIMGAWTYEVTSNRFTGEVLCRLFGRRMTLENNAVVFRFSKNTDTSEAWFQLGAAQARPWRPLIPELLRDGIAVEGDDLMNPSQGRVAIPLRLLASEPIVRLVPTPRGRPVRFVISGLKAAGAAANALGCHFSAPSAAPANSQ